MMAVHTALAGIKDLGEKWNWFSTWFGQNMIAKILWSSSAYKQKYGDARIYGVMLDTNANKSFNARLKTSDSYVMCRG